MLSFCQVNINDDSNDSCDSLDKSEISDDDDNNNSDDDDNVHSDDSNKSFISETEVKIEESEEIIHDCDYEVDKSDTIDSDSHHNCDQNEEIQIDSLKESFNIILEERTKKRTKTCATEFPITVHPKRKVLEDFPSHSIEKSRNN